MLLQGMEEVDIGADKGRFQERHTTDRRGGGGEGKEQAQGSHDTGIQKLETSHDDGGEGDVVDEPHGGESCERVGGNNGVWRSDQAQIDERNECEGNVEVKIRVSVGDPVKQVSDHPYLPGITSSHYAYLVSSVFEGGGSSERHVEVRRRFNDFVVCMFGVKV